MRDDLEIISELVKQLELAVPKVMRELHVCTNEEALKDPRVSPMLKAIKDAKEHLEYMKW